MSHEHHHSHENNHEHVHKHDHTEYVAHECDGAGHEHHHHSDGSCCCEAHAKEFHGIDKPMLIRLIISAVLYLAGMLLPVGEIGEMILMIGSAIAAGYDIVLGALKNLLKARIFDEYFLMSFAAVAAFAIGEAEEGAAVFLLYRIGVFCQNYAIRHSRRTIASLTGECGHTSDQGTINNRFISKFARIYTPVILILAVLIAVLLPLFSSTSFKDSIYRALTFLVLACPCAIVISVPLAYFAGIGAASRCGVFFRDSDALDKVAACKTTVPELICSELNGTAVYRCSFEQGSDAASDLVMKEKDSFPYALAAARKTHRVAKENVWFTIIIKLTVLILSVCGISALWFAVFADSGVTVLVVLNSLRAFHLEKNKRSDAA